MNKLTKIALYVIFFGVLCSSAFASDIVWLCQKGFHDTEFKTAFDKLGLSVDKYVVNEGDKEGTLKKLANDLDETKKLLIVSPLFNFTRRGAEWAMPKEAFDFAKMRRWIEQGGVLVVTDAAYTQISGWVSEIEPSYAACWNNGKCTSDPWQVFDYARNVEPVDPLRGFPNLLQQADMWSHFEDDPKGWKVLTRCSEGKPVFITKEVGKGLIISTIFRLVSTKAVENIVVNCTLRKTGLAIDTFDIPEPMVGPGRIAISLKNDAPRGTELYYEFANDEGKTARFAAPVIGKQVDIAFTNTIRGKVVATLGVTTKKGVTFELLKRPAELPELFVLKPNAYRGIISTKRRVKTVDFRMELNPSTEILCKKPVKLWIEDEIGNTVFSTNFCLAASNVVYKQWVPIALSKDLKPCKYTLKGQLDGRWKSEAAFQILAPQPHQVIIDDDCTFLVNGKPYFPMGIYHIKTIDEIDIIGRMGFNSMQAFTWATWLNDYGIPPYCRRADSWNIKINLEGVQHKDPTVHVNKYKDDTSTLMWYLADEAMEDSLDLCEERNNTFHGYDINHPTFLLSTRSDLYPRMLERCDVFATNAGSPAGKTNKEYTAHLECLDIARRDGEEHKPIIDIPGGFADEGARHHHAIFSGIVHNTRGFYFYCWDQVGGGPVGVGLHNHPVAQVAMSNTLAQVKAVMPGLLSTYRRPFVDDDVHGMVCGTEPKKRFVILVSQSDKKIERMLNVPEMKEKGELQLSLNPKEVKILSW